MRSEPIESETKSETLPLPSTKEETLSLIKKILDLPELQKIEITPQLVVVSRNTSGPVIPKPQDETVADVPSLLTRIADELEHMPPTPEDHPYTILLRAAARLSSRGLKPNWLVTAEGGWLEAYLGLDEEGVDFIYNMRVVRVPPGEYDEKLVVVGSLSSYVTDATAGVIIDMGI